ncbi:LysR family transcriptional regulator [Ochrobactrum intermedium]|uniref:LysR family transcriptional regulator n=1 Tax=Brucella intermedia TaxID=94625 RepID=UPI00128AF4F8|nr:LysR family transcriptional regulator [Brucella intermedia]MPR64318.1 LysR family transcriptional regulator [Brucella intermedia]
MLDARQLRYIQALAEELHFGRAAARLRIAQPALSRQIQQIEANLGTMLFARTQRRVELTPAGELMLDRARSILNEIEQAEIDAKRAGKGELGRLSVGFIHSSSYGFLPRLLRRFHDRFPEVNLELKEMGIAEQINSLPLGAIDIGVTRPAKYASGIETLPVLEEDFLVAVPAFNPLASVKSTSLARLTNESFVLFPRETSPLFNKSIITMCENAGFSPIVSQKATQVHTVVGLVSAGMGVAIVPSTARNLQISGVAFLKIEDEPPPVTIVLAWKANRVTTHMKAFMSIAVSAAREIQGLPNDN